MNCEKAIQPGADKDFTRLIRPFSHEEIIQLLANHSESEPFVFYTWNGILIDDTGYYKCVLQLGMPYEIRPLLLMFQLNIS